MKPDRCQVRDAVRLGVQVELKANLHLHGSHCAPQALWPDGERRWAEEAASLKQWEQPGTASCASGRTGTRVWVHSRVRADEMQTKPATWAAMLPWGVVSTQHAGKPANTIGPHRRCQEPVAEVGAGRPGGVAAAVVAGSATPDFGARWLGVGAEAGADASRVQRRRFNCGVLVRRVQRVDGQQPLRSRPVVQVRLPAEHAVQSAAGASNQAVCCPRYDIDSPNRLVIHSFCRSGNTATTLPIRCRVRADQTARQSY